MSNSKPIKSSGWFVNLVAFVAVICVGVALILSKIGILGQIGGALYTIANVLSYLILCIVSCFYVSRRKNVWLWVVWSVSVVLIVLSYII